MGVVNENVRHWCFNCMLFNASNKDALRRHKELCDQNKAQLCEVPEPGTTLKFSNYKNMVFVPVVCYADFECYQKQTHTASGFGLYVKSVDDTALKSKYISKTLDGGVVEEFLKHQIQIREDYDNVPDRPLVMTDHDTTKHRAADRCWVCNTEFDGSDECSRKVRDHDHFTGVYRGAAHGACNLLLRKPKFIPVLFHNLSGYDSHFLIKAFSSLEETPHGIPDNTEKFKMLSLRKGFGQTEIKFLDSFKFRAKALDKLVGELTSHPILESMFTTQDAEILKRKGVFPYDWFDSFEKLTHTEFPPYSAFKSRLNGGKNITKSDYD